MWLESVNLWQNGHEYCYNCYFNKVVYNNWNRREHITCIVGTEND